MTRYFVLRGTDGDVFALSRIRETSDGTYPEVLSGGEWIEAGWVMEKVFDPDERDVVSEAEATGIAARFGGSL